MKIYQPIWTAFDHRLPNNFNKQNDYIPFRTETPPKDIVNWLKHQSDAQLLEIPSSQKNNWPDFQFHVFTPKSFELLKDILFFPEHEIYTFTQGQWPLAYLIRPAAAPVGNIPTYAEIAASLPNGLHYFRKSQNTEFKLVTETFVERFQQHKLKGLKFHLRWDGEKSYPPVEHLSRAWLEEQMRKKGDL